MFLLLSFGHYHASRVLYCSSFFFFQAEDGIRDLVRSVGSEMCIRDRARRPPVDVLLFEIRQRRPRQLDGRRGPDLRHAGTCLLYTSDAADERSSVDLGGRRIIKKKKRENQPVDG